MTAEADPHLEVRIRFLDGHAWVRRYRCDLTTPGASIFTLARRATYGGRKGRSAFRRLLRISRVVEGEQWELKRGE